MNIVVDFTKPETLHKLAALPRYGWAEALIRRVDPYWHASPPPYSYRVYLGRFERCCSCGQTKDEGKAVIVEADDQDEAERIALQENRGWFVAKVDHPKFPTAPVPDSVLKQFEAAK